MFPCAGPAPPRLRARRRVLFFELLLLTLSKNGESNFQNKSFSQASKALATLVERSVVLRKFRVFRGNAVVVFLEGVEVGPPLADARIRMTEKFQHGD